MITVSIVVPVYSGEAFLPSLFARLVELRESWEKSGNVLRLHELIFVDDSARDGSAALIERLAAENRWVSVFHLSRNYGQHAATVAGIDNSTGDWVVTMDEDLQHPPERIEAMFEKVAGTHCDIVYAQALSDVHERGLRDFASRAYKQFAKYLTGNPALGAFNSFRLIRGNIARGAASICSHDTYFDIVLTWFSTRIQTAAMELKDRRFIETGNSGYDLRALLSHAHRLMLSSHVKPLRISAISGLLIVALSIVGMIALVLLKLLAPAVIGATGWTSIMLAITVFGGLSLLFLGILIEYISLLVLKAHGKPLYFIVDRSSDKQLIAGLSPLLKKALKEPDAKQAAS